MHLQNGTYFHCEYKSSAKVCDIRKRAGCEELELSTLSTLCTDVTGPIYPAVTMTAAGDTVRLV